jgi:hypothetical protein
LQGSGIPFAGRFRRRIAQRLQPDVHDLQRCGLFAPWRAALDYNQQQQQYVSQQRDPDSCSADAQCRT